MYMYDVVGKVKLNKPGICLLYMYNDNYYHEEKWSVIKSFFLRFFFSLGKILYIRFIKFISSNQDIVAKQCKNIHYMHMEYENVVLKRPTTGYEHGRKESVRTITETRNCTDGRRKTIRFRLNRFMLPKNPVNNCLWQETVCISRCVELQ